MNIKKLNEEIDKILKSKSESVNEYELKIYRNGNLEDEYIYQGTIEELLDEVGYTLEVAHEIDKSINLNPTNEKELIDALNKATKLRNPSGSADKYKIRKI